MNIFYQQTVNRIFSDLSNHPKENLRVSLMFISSVWFFMQVFQDLTWFEDELRGNWFIKRLIFASFLSLGYFLQHRFIKNKFPKTSLIFLVLSLVISFLWPIILSMNTKILFAILVFFLFFKTKENVGAIN